MNTRHAIRQQIKMRLEIPVRCADIHPVGPLWNVREERLAVFEQLGEQTVLERIVLALRYEVEHPRLQHVSSGVNIVGRDLVRFGLLEETPDAPVGFSFYQAIRAWVRHRS